MGCLYLLPLWFSICLRQHAVKTSSIVGSVATASRQRGFATDTTTVATSRTKGAAVSRTFIDHSPKIGERSMVMSVSVCLCVCVCLSAIISSELHVRSSPIFVHVTYGRGSVLLWRSDTLSTSGFMDDVIFAHKPRLLDVVAQLKRSAHAALGLAISCAQ